MNTTKIIPPSMLGLLTLSAGLAASGWARAHAKHDFVINPIEPDTGPQPGYRLARFRSSAGRIAVHLSERLPNASKGLPNTGCAMYFDLIEDATDLNFTRTLEGSRAKFSLVEVDRDFGEFRLLPGTIIHWRFDESLTSLHGHSPDTNHATVAHQTLMCSWDMPVISAETEETSSQFLQAVALNSDLRLSALQVESSPRLAPATLSSLRGSVQLNRIGQLTSNPLVDQPAQIASRYMNV